MDTIYSSDSDAIITFVPSPKKKGHYVVELSRETDCKYMSPDVIDLPAFDPKTNRQIDEAYDYGVK